MDMKSEFFFGKPVQYNVHKGVTTVKTVYNHYLEQLSTQSHNQTFHTRFHV